MLLRLRWLAKLRFSLLGHATIKDIPTDDFHLIIAKLQSQGWRKTYETSPEIFFDAWIDYGKIVLRKGFKKLTFEWDNWTEGSIEGRHKIISSIALENNIEASMEWRWAEFDED